MLAAFLGLRREEICGLQWKNVDFEKSTLTINQAITMAGSQRIEKSTKSFSSVRELYIPESVMACLKREKEYQEKLKEQAGIEPEDDLVVVMANGKRYRPNYISELFTKFIKEHDLPKITLHGLRHTFATIANSLGRQLYDISKAMGHSNTSVTSGVYTHLLDPNHKEMIEEMDKAIRGK
ncbi:MAG: site-specific integrase [Clostridium sp.]|nr:site-specific integrase [Clostridium sp.]